MIEDSGIFLCQRLKILSFYDYHVSDKKGRGNMAEWLLDILFHIGVLVFLILLEIINLFH